MTFPPINLWSAPVQNITYDFKGYKADQDPTIKALRGQKMRDYMAKLKHFADNPMIPLAVSELVIESRHR